MLTMFVHHVTYVLFFRNVENDNFQKGKIRKIRYFVIYASLIFCYMKLKKQANAELRGTAPSANIPKSMFLKVKI